jgi:drug/metabolite transporter (DMT)-like permease
MPDERPAAVPPSAPGRGLETGVPFALVSAASFALVITLARLAYQGGANPNAAIELRLLAAAAAMALIVRLRGGTFAVPRHLRLGLCGVALGVFLLTLGYLSSVAFIPVSLAVVIFYTYPLMVAAISPALGTGRLSPRHAAAFVLAFAGLVLAVGPAFDSVDWRGLALAFLAAVSATWLFVVSPRVVGEYDVFGVSLYVNLAAAALMVPVIVLSDGLAPPESAAGWGGLIGVALFYICAVAAQFAALGKAGAVRTALAFNLEPVVAVAAAMVLLGERPGLVRLLGVAMVLAALTLAALRRR